MTTISERPKINTDEQAVLTVLASIYNHDGNCYPFAPIAERTDLETRRVRLACRSLARKGFAEFVRGLWTDDGEMAGSGYCCTEPGLAALRAIQAGEK